MNRLREITAGLALTGGLISVAAAQEAQAAEPAAAVYEIGDIQALGGRMIEGYCAVHQDVPNKATCPPGEWIEDDSGSGSSNSGNGNSSSSGNNSSSNQGSNGSSSSSNSSNSSSSSSSSNSNGGRSSQHSSSQLPASETGGPLWARIDDSVFAGDWNRGEDDEAHMLWSHDNTLLFVDDGSGRSTFERANDLDVELRATRGDDGSSWVVYMVSAVDLRFLTRAEYLVAFDDDPALSDTYDALLATGRPPSNWEVIVSEVDRFNVTPNAAQSEVLIAFIDARWADATTNVNGLTPGSFADGTVAIELDVDSVSATTAP